MTVIAEMSTALGSGTGTTMIFFPITYYAMRKQFKLKPLSKLWRPFWGCVVLFAILYYLFGEFDPTSSAAAFAMYIFLPIVVSATILHWAGRENVGNTS